MDQEEKMVMLDQKALQEKKGKKEMMDKLLKNLMSHKKEEKLNIQIIQMEEQELKMKE